MSYESDKELTLRNRKLIVENKNLMFWYEKLFTNQLKNIDTQVATILEIGSGTSPVKHFFPKVITSDVLDLDYIDHIFDCHLIHEFDDIPGNSLDAIIMTNVLHHLKEPVEFLFRAAGKLKQGGIITATEPYLSLFSNLIYKYIHHEAMDKRIKEPLLRDDEGPLSSANIALPYLIFFRHKDWSDPLSNIYELSIPTYYTSIAYFVSGGISRRSPISIGAYKKIFSIDSLIATRFPKIFASFFNITLVKR